MIQNETSFLLTKTKFKTLAEKKEFLDNEIAHLKEMLSDNFKNKKEYELSIDKIEKHIQDSKNALEIIEKEVAQNESELKGIQKTVLNKKMEKIKLASDFRENIEKITDLSFEIDEHTKNLKSYKDSLDYKFRDNFFSTICKLKEIIKERDITGFYGLFIDVIQFEPRLRLSIESLAKNKLYSVIVEDYDTAKILVQINKEIRGGMLNIYPLTWTKELKVKQRNYPKSQDAMVLKDKIKISKDFANKNEEIETLIGHIFGKALLVKNYDLALKFSQEYKLNCVTAKGEIVYSQGYLTKVGFCEAAPEKLNLYLKYQSIEAALQSQNDTLEFERKKTNQLHSSEISLLRDMQELGIKESHIKKNNETLKVKLEDLKTNIKNDETSVYGIQSLINRIEGENEKIEQKILFFTNEKNVKQLNETSNLTDYQNRNEELLKLQTKYNDLKEQLILTEEKINEANFTKLELQKEMTQNEKSHTTTTPERQARNMEKESLDNIVKDLEKHLKLVEKKEKELEKNKKELEGKESEIDDEIHSKQMKLVELERAISQKKQTKNGYLAQKEDYYQKKVKFFS